MKTSTLIGTAVFLGIVVLALGFWVYQVSFAEFNAHEENTASLPFVSDPIYGVETMGLPTQPTVLTDAVTHGGKPVEVACVTCHTTRSPVKTNRSAEDLDEFHQGLIIAHGNLSCLSCHNPENYDTLKLADGSAVSFENAMQLCAQCHGPQTRDYKNGSHGGMTGYWDLSRGPRQRNACTVCHDAHAPAYPEMMPVFAPTDLVPPESPPHSEH